MILIFNKKTRMRRVLCMAEREGFEPSLRYERKHDFESCAFNHSATSPDGADALLGCAASPGAF